MTLNGPTEGVQRQTEVEQEGGGGSPNQHQAWDDGHQALQRGEGREGEGREGEGRGGEGRWVTPQGDGKWVTHPGA